MNQLRLEDFTEEEWEKCRQSPAYFYNKYWKVFDKDGNEIAKKELTDAEFEEKREEWETIRNTPAIRGRNGYPLTIAECFKK